MPRCSGFALSLVGMCLVAAVIMVESGPAWAILVMGVYLALAGVVKVIYDAATAD